MGSSDRGRDGETVTSPVIVLPVLSMGQQVCEPDLAWSGLTSVTSLLNSTCFPSVSGHSYVCLANCSGLL